MRSYGQLCAVARALDVVGDRWTLLIVRELLARQPCRYTDLRYGLPGIATNLLADRLRELEENGLVVREAAPPPIATTVFRLTRRGEELRPVLEVLGRWGRPFLQETSGEATFRSHWLAVPLEMQLRDHTPDEPPVAIEVHTADQPVSIVTADGGVRVRGGPVAAPDAIVTGPPRLVLGLLMGDLDVETAEQSGLRIEGDVDAVRRIRTPIPST
ncbi:MAG TPA: winged helix-turn-helix transcriptional regulator [Acidimicrobiales bacterium]|nr:winged helix-turn-helix transcriptional regulator [Acidimicrobiales bacterium]